MNIVEIYNNLKKGGNIIMKNNNGKTGIGQKLR